MVDVLGRLGAERARQRRMERGVVEMVGAADHVRDPEVDVVHDGGELVRRPAVGAQKRRSPLLAEPHRAVVLALGLAGLEHPRRDLGVALGPLALVHRPLVPGDPEPGRGRRGSPPPRSASVRASSVSSIRRMK